MWCWKIWPINWHYLLFLSKQIWIFAHITSHVWTEPHVWIQVRAVTPAPVGLVSPGSIVSLRCESVTAAHARTEVFAQWVIILLKSPKTSCFYCHWGILTPSENMNFIKTSCIIHMHGFNVYLLWCAPIWIGILFTTDSDDNEITKTLQLTFDILLSGHLRTIINVSVKLLSRITVQTWNNANGSINISLKHLLPFSPYRILIKVTSAPVCLALRELTVNTVCSPAQTLRAFMAADATRRITGAAMRVTVPEATLV